MMAPVVGSLTPKWKTRTKPLVPGFDLRLSRTFVGTLGSEPVDGSCIHLSLSLSKKKKKTFSNVNEIMPCVFNTFQSLPFFNCGAQMSCAYVSNLKTYDGYLGSKSHFKILLAKCMILVNLLIFLCPSWHYLCCVVLGTTH